jgi:PAT family beta-lactamase induction signal transducer AmpG|tara:strand:- start:937 stop:2199 length:1263 start_codon:yes stop_codon:yes gene_type:complete
MASWKESFSAYLQPRLFIILFLGFSSGLPFGMLIDPLNFWLSEEEISRSSIGLLSLITLTYPMKVAWSPFIDRLKIPLLSSSIGQRKSWLFLTQLVVSIALIGMAITDPKSSLSILVAFALLVAFFSATQDICIDAMRIELVEEKELGEATAMYQAGWRLAFLVSQVATFFIASLFDWSSAYFCSAVLMLLILITCFLKVPEPEREEDSYIALTSKPLAWVFSSYVKPFLEIFNRLRDRIFLILLLVITYRFSDLLLGPMAMPFYRETGFTKEEVAIITNAFGIIVTMTGAFLGGLLIYRYNIMKTVLVGALLVAITNLFFAGLDVIGHNIAFLTLTISVDNLSQGLAGTALIAYLSSLTNQNFTATQYALLFSLAVIPGKLLASSSGFIVDYFGYFNFFIFASLMGIPAIYLALKLQRS